MKKYLLKGPVKTIHFNKVKTEKNVRAFFKDVTDKTVVVAYDMDRIFDGRSISTRLAGLILTFLEKHKGYFIGFVENSYQYPLFDRVKSRSQIWDVCDIK